ncbi:MAG: OadG family transporter subunit [Bacteroidales bacterium]|nr:OadG family transporter subunit [Bacteroidales bacterium]MDD4670160.1 OadG family transporter subunit [Bacteroidales bacterium]
MKSIKYILVSGLLLLSLSLSAQHQSSMRINEILVTNTSDFQDDFGQHNGWLELFNTSYGTVDVGGCFLSNDRNNLKMYIIPKGDVLTKIKPRQHILFWADNQPYRGTFHTNFTLAESDTLFFISSDGRTIIDAIAIPKDLGENKSYGRIQDGIGSITGDGEGYAYLDRTSPSTNNYGVDAETKSMIMAKTDPHGSIMSLTAMSVVFLALIILAIIFTYVGKLSVRKMQKTSDATAVGKDESKPAAKVSEVSSETFAAIALALHLYSVENETHDDESFAITMTHTDRTYSPWSSKIYGLRQTPQIKK